MRHHAVHDLCLALALAAFLMGAGALAQDSNVEQQAWNAALENGTPAAFEGYLQAYPAGRFAGSAFRCLVETKLQADTGAGAGCAVGPGSGPAKPGHSETGNYVANLN